MRCPERDKIIDDWRRVRNGEPMFLAAHIAECERCKAIFDELDQLAECISPLDSPADGNHVGPELQAAYAERRLRRAERRMVE